MFPVYSVRMTNSRTDTSKFPRVGFWAGPNETADLPDPHDLVDPAWDLSERLAVLSHLEAGKVSARWRGFSTCRICGKRNGSQDRTDSTYVWPQGLSHYVRDHDVKPDQAFIDHVMAD